MFQQNPTLFAAAAGNPHYYGANAIDPALANSYSMSYLPQASHMGSDLSGSSTSGTYQLPPNGIAPTNSGMYYVMCNQNQSFNPCYTTINGITYLTGSVPNLNNMATQYIQQPVYCPQVFGQTINQNGAPIMNMGSINGECNRSVDDSSGGRSNSAVDLTNLTSAGPENLPSSHSVDAVNFVGMDGQTRNAATEHNIRKKKIVFYNNILFKTEVCKDYEATRTCPRGVKCQFAHGYEDLRKPSDHPLFRTTLCEDFMNMHRCPRGNNCYHAHSEKELRVYQRRRDYSGFKRTVSLAAITENIDEEGAYNNCNRDSNRSSFLTRHRSMTDLTPVAQPPQGCYD